MKICPVVPAAADRIRIPPSSTLAWFVMRISSSAEDSPAREDLLEATTPPDPLTLWVRLHHPPKGRKHRVESTVHEPRRGCFAREVKDKLSAPTCLDEGKAPRTFRRPSFQYFRESRRIVSWSTRMSLSIGRSCSYERGSSSSKSFRACDFFS